MSTRPARILTEARTGSVRQARPIDRLAARALTIVVVVVVGAAALPHGSYALPARTLLAVTLLWVILLGIAFGVFSAAGLEGLPAVVLILFAGFAAWTLASTLWAADSARAFEEFNRVVLYLAVLAIATLGATRRTLGQWVDGLFLAIVFIAVLALGSRLFFAESTGGDLATFIPNAASRLSYPIGYWNALGALAALGCPLCIRAGVVSRTALGRTLALAAAPILAAVLVLTSSRGAALAALVGIAVLLTLTDGRWAAFRVACSAALGASLAIAVLTRSEALVDGPLGTELARDQSRTAALLIVLSSIAAGGALLIAERIPAPKLWGRVPRWVPPAVAVALVVIAAVSVRPAERFESFRAPPGTTSEVGLAAHLLSGGGSGRWQFWTVAFEEFERAPLQGQGAGSYESSWARYASFSYSIKNAHSLFLETLSELGLVGLLLLVGALGTGLAAALGRTGGSEGEPRVTLAALTAVVVAFLVAAALDWVWQIPVVAVVAIAALGLIVSPRAAGRVARIRARSDPRSRIAGAAVALGIAWVLICAQLIPWLAAERIADSQAAARRGDLGSARRHALDAERLQPWSSAPYLQLALVAEREGRLPEARQWLASALAKDAEDWRLWLIASRLERAAGLPERAARSLATAQSLNPRSPLVASQ